MRNLLTALLLVVSSVVPVAAENFVDAGIGYRFMSERKQIDNVDYQTGIQSIAPYVAFYSVDSITKTGVGVRSSISFPFWIKEIADGDSRSIDVARYDYIFGLDLMAGWARQFDTGSDRVGTFSIGPHLSSLYSSSSLDDSLGPYTGFQSYVRASYSIGVAAVGNYAFPINDTVYMNTGFQFNFGFWNISYASYGGRDQTDSRFLTIVTANPSLGIGFRH